MKKVESSKIEVLPPRLQKSLTVRLLGEKQYIVVDGRVRVLYWYKGTYYRIEDKDD